MLSRLAEASRNLPFGFLFQRKYGAKTKKKIEVYGVLDKPSMVCRIILTFLIFKGRLSLSAG